MITSFLNKHHSEANSFIVILDIVKEQEIVTRRLELYNNEDQVERSKLEQYLKDLDKFNGMISQASGDVKAAIRKYAGVKWI